MSAIIPVILAGGSGTRLWPSSRALLPKQLLPLVGLETMLQATVRRVAHFENPVVVTGADHRFLVAAQLQELGRPASALVVEPAGRNTAPAVLTAAMLAEAKTPGSMVLILPADHHISDTQAFASAIATGVQQAEKGRLMTFGIVPGYPETGYGYIEGDTPLDDEERAFAVKRFIEKPDRDRAEELLAAGNFFWNAGIFLFKASSLIEAMRAHAPDVVAAVRRAIDEADDDQDFLRLGSAFLNSPNVSIDVAVMEKHDNIGVVPVEMGWNDIGSWAALWEVSGKDRDGNSADGDVLIEDSRNCLVRASDGRLVTALGLDDVVIIDTADALLVAHRDRAQDVKQIVAKLKEKERPESDSHRRVHRPWGWYESLENRGSHQVKHLYVSPGQKISLQSHNHRAEHWTVVSGYAEVVLDEVVHKLRPNESIMIPVGSRHRLANIGDEPLSVIEVQCGDYLGEDDIVRYEDIYGRLIPGR